METTGGRHERHESISDRLGSLLSEKRSSIASATPEFYSNSVSFGNVAHHNDRSKYLFERHRGTLPGSRARGIWDSITDAQLESVTDFLQGHSEGERVSLSSPTKKQLYEKSKEDFTLRLVDHLSRPPPPQASEFSLRQAAYKTLYLQAVAKLNHAGGLMDEIDAREKPIELLDEASSQLNRAYEVAKGSGTVPKALWEELVLTQGDSPFIETSQPITLNKIVHAQSDVLLRKGEVQVKNEEYGKAIKTVEGALRLIVGTNIDDRKRMSQCLVVLAGIMMKIGDARKAQMYNDLCLSFCKGSDQDVTSAATEVLDIFGVEERVDAGIEESIPEGKLHVTSRTRAEQGVIRTGGGYQEIQVSVSSENVLPMRLDFDEDGKESSQNDAPWLQQGGEGPSERLSKDSFLQEDYDYRDRLEEAHRRHLNALAKLTHGTKVLSDAFLEADYAEYAADVEDAAEQIALANPKKEVDPNIEAQRKAIKEMMNERILRRLKSESQSMMMSARFGAKVDRKKEMKMKVIRSRENEEIARARSIVRTLTQT